jgi:SAM-dependent methyltransferase
MLLALYWGLARAQPAAPGVRYEPSPVPVVQAMTELAAVRAGDLVYDLGCGDGRIVIAAAKLGARAVCVDIDPVRIADAQENARSAGVAERIEFRTEDLFAVDLGAATVVMLFLSPEFNLKLRPRLQALKPGTRIVSHWHRMGDWKPQKELSVPRDSREHPVYLWVVSQPGR